MSGTVASVFFYGPADASATTPAPTPVNMTSTQASALVAALNAAWNGSGPAAYQVDQYTHIKLTDVWKIMVVTA